MSLVHHRFGPEGSAYVRAQLEFAWDPLAGLLLAAHDIECGSAWGFVPEQWSEERRQNFDLGSLPEESGSWGITWEWVHERLQTLGDGGLLVAEDPLASRDDCFSYPERGRSPIFFCGENVYPFATGETPDLLRVLWPDYPTVAMLTRRGGVDPTHLGHADVEPETLAQMAYAAEAIIVAAWDAVGFVIWEPA